MAIQPIPLQPANNLSDLASASTARTNLGLGSAATQASSAFDAAGAAATAQSNAEAYAAPASALPLWSAVTSSNFTTSSATLANITGLTLALAANTTYDFEAHLSANSTVSVTFGVNFSASGATVEAQCMGTSSATVCHSNRISALNTPTTATYCSGIDGAIVIKGRIVVGANAGNLTIQMLETGGAGTGTIYIGSVLKAQVSV